MAKRDFDEYYYKIVNQYQSLQETLEDMSKQVSESMMEPERLETLKKTIAPVVTSFQTLSYIKYLLDKPTRAKKQHRYNKRNKLLKQSGSYNADAIIATNDTVIKDLKL